MLHDIIGWEKQEAINLQSFDQLRVHCLESGGDVQTFGLVKSGCCEVCGGSMISLSLIMPDGESTEFDQCVKCFSFFEQRPVYEGEEPYQSIVDR